MFFIKEIIKRLLRLTVNALGSYQLSIFYNSPFKLYFFPSNSDGMLFYFQNKIENRKILKKNGYLRILR